MSSGPRRAALLAATTALLASFLCGCGEPAPTSPAPEPAQPAPAPSEVEGAGSSAATPEGAIELGSPAGPPTAATGPEASTGRDTSTACVRAEPCCRAFVEAIGDDAEAERARRACDDLDRLEDLAGASGEACLAAIEGWRQALELREREVPLSCR